MDSDVSVIPVLEQLRTKYKVRCNRCLHFNSDMSTVHEVMETAAAEIERLVNELREARDCVQSWGAYAAEYFQEKWDLQGDIARFDAVLADYTDVPAPAIE